MNLTEAVDDSLRDWFDVSRLSVKLPITNKRGLSARLSALQRLHGGKPQAARALGIPASTWRAWTSSVVAKRRPPSRANQRKINNAYEQLLRQRAHGRPVSRGGKIGPTKVEIRALIVFDPGPKGGPQGARYTNRINPHRLFKALNLPADDVRATVTIWASFGPAAAADYLEERCSAAYPPGVAFEGDDVTVTWGA